MNRRKPFQDGNDSLLELRSQIMEQGKEVGLTGEDLIKFIREEYDWECKRRDKEAELQREDRDAERLFQLRKLEIEGTNLAQANLNNNNNASLPRSYESQYIPKIPYLTDDDKDPESFLRQFELFARHQKLSELEKASRIVYLLKGKARTIVAKLSDDDLLSYDIIKSALLEGFQLNAEQYRKKFRQAKREEGETYKEMVVRLDRYLTKWIQLEGSTSFDMLKDLILKEQVLRLLDPDLRVFIKDRKPETAKTIGVMAMDYEINRNTGKPKEGNRNKGQGKPINPVKPSPFEGGNKEKGTFQSSEKKPLSREEKERLKRTGACFRCFSKGHKISECPLEESKASAVHTQETDADWIYKLSMLCDECCKKDFTKFTLCKINDHTVKAMRDTGSDDICVDSELVQPFQYTSRVKRTKYAKKDIEEQCRIAIVDMDTPFFKGKTEVVVIENASQPVLIGDRYGISPETKKTPIYPVRKPDWFKNPETQVTPVQTRAETAKENASRPETTHCGVSNERNAEFLCTPKEMIQAQQDDQSLIMLRRAAEEGKMKHGSSMVYRRGILYQSKLDRKGHETLRLVVPKPFREKVLIYAHDHPLAGHCSHKRTTDKICREFWWPSCATEIKRYCQSCDVCQRNMPKCIKAPLGRMPTFVCPWKNVAIDLIGPIEPMSEDKHRFILVMIDYATRYPEAVPLKDAKAETIADALFVMWTRLGFPEQLMSDNASNFTGSLMTEVLETLRVKHRVTSVYNARGNGLVERTNGRLKSMLRKMCSEAPRTWHKMIDALLFSCREMPSESLGFSPFELLYGRTVRGPMQLLRQVWTEEDLDEEVKMTAEYVVDLRNKLEQTCALARENLKKASVRHAKYYNKKTRARFLREGDKVLVLIPRKKNALQLAWAGPYQVTEVINQFDYRIQMGRKTRVFHINLLKLYFCREPVDKTSAGEVPIETQDDPEEDTEETHINLVIEEDIGEQSDDWYPENVHSIPVLQTQQTETYERAKINPDLTESRQQEVKQKLRKNQRICTDVPLITKILEAGIFVTDKNPVFVKPRPIPHAMVGTVEQEIDQMLKIGVIEPANSPYNSPILLVKKSSGEFRFCQDLRKLNDVIVFDGEPMTDVEHMFQSLGEAKYFTKIDLTKGYWGIRLREEDRDKTAFVTSKGQFRWVTMPFGLKTAPGIFNRMMRKLLEPLDRRVVHHFMDDILIATSTWEEHMKVLEEVLDRLNEVNLAAKPSKMFIGYTELTYLGHVLGNGQRWPESEKTEKILNAPNPKTKGEVRSLLGQAGFYREYIPEFSSLTAPLSDLTKKDQPEKVVWTSEAQVSLDQLKSKLSQKPILKMPDHSKEYVLRTDASNKGIGAVLLQQHGEKLFPISYQSRKLKTAEKNYATVEKECLGTVWGIQKFERYLYGRKFVLETDHKPLQYLQKNATNPRLLRWALQLQPYQFSVRVIPGKDNHGADYLSRVI